MSGHMTGDARKRAAEGHSSGGTGHDWMTAAEAQAAYEVRKDVARVVADALHNTPGVECDHVEGLMPTCESDADHVAAALAPLLAQRIEQAKAGVADWLTSSPVAMSAAEMGVYAIEGCEADPSVEQYARSVLTALAEELRRA